MIIRLLICLSFFIFTSCGLFVQPAARPVVEDHSGNLGTLATLAQRRMVITKKIYKNEKRELGIWHGGHYESKFCAEPPPDAVDDLVSTIKLTLNASNNQDIGVKTEVANALKTVAKSLFKRSQGIQFFRDATYTLCQASLNGDIGEEEYCKIYKEIMKISKEIIILELPDLVINNDSNQLEKKHEKPQD